MTYSGEQFVMSEKVFARLSEFIGEELGIRMHEGKKVMLQSRLLKRLRIVGMNSFDEYCEYVFSPQGRKGELQNLLNAVTTNKTDFFREPKHFTFLTETALPDLIANQGAGVQRAARIWSAGCSTGKEVYTLAMVLADYSQNRHRFRFSVAGTDISTRVLEQAKTGIYDMEDADAIPANLRNKYLLKSKDHKKRLIRMSPEIRSLVTFRKMNLMAESYYFADKMDIIFCRNVFIYFDRPTQKAVLDKLCRQLIPGGYLFTGHSEGLNGFNRNLVQVTHAVFKKN